MISLQSDRGVPSHSRPLALLRHRELDAETICREEALTVAGEICIYTNPNFTVETLSTE